MVCYLRNIAFKIVFSVTGVYPPEAGLKGAPRTSGSSNIKGNILLANSFPSSNFFKSVFNIYQNEFLYRFITKANWIDILHLLFSHGGLQCRSDKTLMEHWPQCPIPFPR